MIRLDGYRVVVTGGGRGIGAACCELFAAAGAAVCVHYRERRDSAEAVLGRMARPAEGDHLLVAADLASADGVSRLFEAVSARWEALDCLVNNAGIWVANPLRKLDPARLVETWRVNLTAPFLCLADALPLLELSPNASVVNLSSTAGQRGEAGYSPYAASKGALISATKSWATELAPGVRVNAVAPGWVDTEMCVEPFAGDGRRRIEGGIPLGRVAPPEDVAGPVVFLASPLARHITGEILNVNGGAVLAG